MEKGIGYELDISFNIKNKKIFVILITLLIIILLTILFFIYSNPHNDSPKAIINGNIINLKLATTPFEQQKGLMFREYLDENSGMLFIYQDEQIRQFWMKNTFIPLDMLFIDSDGRIIDIQSAEPCMEDPCRNYISKFPAKYVLEVNAGYSERNNLSLKDRIDFKDISLNMPKY